jgi:hypothetical protein
VNASTDPIIRLITFRSVRMLAIIVVKSAISSAAFLPERGTRFEQSILECAES